LRLLLVHRELQLAHDLAQSLQRLVGVAVPAQDHELVGIVAPRRIGQALDPGRLIFIDATWTKTNMAWLYGWGRVGHRLVDAGPHGHCNTSTFIAGLRQEPGCSLCVQRCSQWLAVPCLRRALVPTLTSGDIVIMDKLGSHKVAGVRQAIEAVFAKLLYLPLWAVRGGPT
jgi:hypothetical protein